MSSLRGFPPETRNYEEAGVEVQSIIEFLDLKGDVSGDFVVKGRHNLLGRVFSVPDGVTLRFEGGSFYNGRLDMGNNTALIDGVFINDGAMTYHRNVVGGKNVDYCVAVSVLDKRNVSISGCVFKSDLQIEPVTNLGVFVYGTSEKGSSEIVIDNCSFNGCCMGFFSNTSDCFLTNTTFTEWRHFLSIETLYNMEHKKNYCYPSNIYVKGCRFICSDSDPSVPPIWCSGFKNIQFWEDYFETDCTMMQLYCGDLNIAAEKALLINCSFVVNRSSSKKTSVVCVNGMGRSFPHLSEEKSFGEIALYNNRFSIKENDASGLEVCRAINLRFINEVSIIGNEFSGFGEAICLSDSYQGKRWETTVARVINNSFKDNNTALSLSKRDDEKRLEIKQLLFTGNEIESMPGAKSVPFDLDEGFGMNVFSYSNTVRTPK